MTTPALPAGAFAAHQGNLVRHFFCVELRGSGFG